MKSTGGYNPIYHDCEKSGCWNVKYRPNIEYFAHAFPRNISMMDIDATVEVNGSFLFLEWKSFSGEIPTGQRIYFERITQLSPKITAVIVVGDCETMTVQSYQIFSDGKAHEPVSCNLDDLFLRIERWASRATKQTQEALNV